MKRLRIPALALVSVLGLASCIPAAVTAAPSPSPSSAVLPDDPDAPGPLDRAFSDFSWSLLRAARTEGQDIVLSPLSVYLALAMTAGGAGGDTWDQFDQLLTSGAGQEALDQYCAQLLETEAAFPNGTVLSISNSLWTAPRVRLADAFVQRAGSVYQAESRSADFTDPQTLADLNDWISAHTGGHIPQALEAIAPETALILVDAVRFQGTWDMEFSPEDTHMGTAFHRADGSVGTVDRMDNGSAVTAYRATSREQAALIDYKDHGLSFLVLLPAEGTGLTDYLSTLDGGYVDDLLEAAHGTDLHLEIPRFEAAWRDSLVSTLTAMGLGAAFDPDAADFSALGTTSGGTPLFLNSVEHGAGLQIDEAGTEAHAFASVGVADGSSGAPVSTAELILDRPFIYAVIDRSKGLPLFAGTFEGSGLS